MKQQIEDVKKKLEACRSYPDIEIDDNITLQAKKNELNQRVNLEQTYGTLMVSQEVKKILTYLNKQQSSYLDSIPDPLCVVLKFITKDTDIKSLFLSLSSNTRKRLELPFVNRLQQLWKYDLNILQSCISPSFYCHQPILCLRCYLYNYCMCMKCKKKIVCDDLTNRGHIIGCNSNVRILSKKATIILAQCNAIKTCMNKKCNAKYHENDKNFAMKVNHICDCFIFDGCVDCLVQCRHCGNISCNNSSHFQTLNCTLNELREKTYQLKQKNTSDWTWCDECNSRHCCRFRQNDQCEWDYCECPILEHKFEIINPYGNNNITKRKAE